MKKGFLLPVLFIYLAESCTKLVDIPPPVSSITTNQTFSTNAQATSAMSGVYHSVINAYGNPSVDAGGMTIFGGLSADELKLFNTGLSDHFQFYNNLLVSSNNDINLWLWVPSFTAIYGANAVLGGLSSSSGVDDSVKKELTGEAKFVRAFSNFNLVNLFGDIPNVTTVNWRNTNLLARDSADVIYNSIIADLKDAAENLPVDYSVGGGQRIIPNKWAAIALLARVYLYKKDYINAQEQSTLLINSGLFNLSSDLNTVFSVSSTEAIWQLQQDILTSTYNATGEGFMIIPNDGPYQTPQPFVYLTTDLLNAFEMNDNRKTAWVDSIYYGGVLYYFPYKYKLGPGEAVSGGPLSEYSTVLRLAEQYLIRAEARAQIGTDLTGAADDLNEIRSRSGLQNTTATTQPELLSAIIQERRIELFAEWGHRWLDLKRTGQASSVLSINKGFVVSVNALLFPIPAAELQVDPNLTQNSGY